MPPTNEPQVNNVWAQSAPIGVHTILTLPSGQVCKAKRLGMEGILSAGLLGDADSLTSYVGKKHLRQVRGGKGADHEELNMKTLVQDTETLKKVVFLVDRAVPMIVVEPEVHSHIRFLDDGTTQMIPPEDRVPGVYTDQIDLQDKMFLFQFSVGGSGNLERFRSESDAIMADVPDGEDVPRAPITGTPSTGKRRRPPRRR